MQQHFVTFYSPGTIVAETTTKPIATWNVDDAMAMAALITERHGAKAYGFRFITRGRADDDLDSKIIASSPMHYIGGKVETLEEVEARNDPAESILRANMRGNGYNRIWSTMAGWKWTQPLNDDDVVVSA
ncbi:hypothetical protein [Polynucleobacter sp.]